MVDELKRLLRPSAAVAVVDRKARAAAREAERKREEERQRAKQQVQRKQARPLPPPLAACAPASERTPF
jgi:hypothetical protein